MPHFIKVIAINVAILGVLAMAYFIFTAPPAIPSSSETASVAPSEKDGDRPIIDAYELTKNPFRMKDQYAVLDTGHMPYPVGASEIVRSGRGGRGSIEFEHMLDDGVAVYTVSPLLYLQSGEEEEELLVEIPDNNPPDASKPWLVLVEGTSDGTNGYGATIQTATVKFIRYAVLPIPPPFVPGQPSAPAPVPTPQTPAGTEPLPTEEPTLALPPAPIIRMTQVTLPDGDIVFSSPSGCRAILSRMLPNNQVQYVTTFEDGATGVFSPNELDKAGAAVAEHCQEGR
jgi:hypothetical protein